MKRFLLSSACLLAVVSLSSTQALGSSLTVDGAYDHYNFRGLNTDGFNVNGAANLPLAWGHLSAEVSVGDDGIGGAHDFDVGGGVVWTEPAFRLAGTAIYNRGSAFGSNLNETTISGGGEWYPCEWLTLGAQVGGIAGDLAGGFVSGAVKGYVTPDLSVGGFVNYSNWKNPGLQKIVSETDFGVKGEFLLSEFLPGDLPLAIQGGYTHQQLEGFGGFAGPFAHDNVYSIGLRLYLDSSSAPAPLIQRNRTGTLDTIGPIHPLWFNF